MAVRSPPDDDSGTDPTRDHDDARGDPRTAHDAADDVAAVALQHTAWLCGYPTCGGTECDLLATTAVIAPATDALTPMCRQCSLAHLAEGARECGLDAYAAAVPHDRPVETAFTRVMRGGFTEYLLSPTSDHSGPTTKPDPDNDQWIWAANTLGSENAVVELKNCV